MKFSLAVLTLSLGKSVVDAFPALDPQNLRGLTPEKLNAAIRSVEDYQKEKRFFIDVTKPIDVSGKHAFQAPKSTDQRGPCPGLNALANHGYISHTGITSFAEVVTAINQGRCCKSRIGREALVLTFWNYSHGYGYRTITYTWNYGYGVDRQPTVSKSRIFHWRSSYWTCWTKPFGKSDWASWYDMRYLFLEPSCTATLNSHIARQASRPFGSAQLDRSGCIPHAQ